MRERARYLRERQVPLALIVEELGVPLTTVYGWTRDIKVRPLTRDGRTRYLSKVMRENGASLEERRRVLNSED